MFLTLLYFGLNAELVQNPRYSLMSFIGVQACGVSIILGGTAAFASGFLSETPWQVLCGLGIFMSYGTMGSPTLDALFAVTKADGTSSFMVFTCDGMGYLGTIAVLLLKDFGGGKDDAVAHDKAVFKALALSFSSVVLVSIFPLELYFYRRKYANARGCSGGGGNSGEDSALLLEDRVGGGNDDSATEGKMGLHEDEGEEDDTDRHSHTKVVPGDREQDEERDVGRALGTQTSFTI